MKLLLMSLIIFCTSSCSIISGSFDDYSGSFIDRFGTNHSGIIREIERREYERGRVTHSYTVKCKKSK